jgi:hypothetical protein
MKNKLTYDKIIELVNLGRELCPYVRNPTYRDEVVHGQCAITRDFRKCKDGLADFNQCERYKHFRESGLDG